MGIAGISLLILVPACLLPASLFAQTDAVPATGESFQWTSAIRESLGFLAIEHGLRIATDPDTRNGLPGPFWRDYARSVAGISGWGDGDPWQVNYVGHPFQGAVSGFIEVQNDPSFRTAEFGKSSRYWHSRLRALAFAAAYSTQFEIGPISEASIGNVGLKKGTAGAVDLVVTPIGGFGVMVAEDWLDRCVDVPFERWTTKPLPRALARGLLNPNRSLANMLRGRLPWHRDTRPGITTP
jgi:hypothetical protein